jgi:hypothetical protein
MQCEKPEGARKVRGRPSDPSTELVLVCFARLVEPNCCQEISFPGSWLHTGTRCGPRRRPEVTGLSPGAITPVAGGPERFSVLYPDVDICKQRNHSLRIRKRTRSAKGVDVVCLWNVGMRPAVRLCPSRRIIPGPIPAKDPADRRA